MSNSKSDLSMSDSVPNDVVEDILRRLPLASLIRFRLLSKGWDAALEKLKIEERDPPALFIYEEKEGEGILRVANCDGGLRREAGLQFHDNTLRAISGLHQPPEVSLLIGGCGGLLAFGCKDGKILITNPARRESHLTPAVLTRPLEDFDFGCGLWYIRVGIGFGCAREDLKIVHIYQDVEVELKTMNSEILCYNVSKGSLEMNDQFPYMLAMDHQNRGIFVEGVLHWTTAASFDDPHSAHGIVGVDLGLGKWATVAEPEYPDGKSMNIRIGEVGKKLCLFSNDNEQRYVYVFLMKDYGVKESWMNLVSVAYPDASFTEVIRALGFSPNQQQIVLQWDGNRVAWHGLEGGEVEGTAITVVGRKYNNAVIVCSLGFVPPDGKFRKIEHDSNTKKNTADDEVAKAKDNGRMDDKDDDFQPSRWFKLKFRKPVQQSKTKKKTADDHSVAKAKDNGKKNDKDDDFQPSRWFKLKF